MTEPGIAAKLSRHLQRIAHGLTQFLEEEVGEPVPWFLCVFTNPRSSYVGNTDRSQVVAGIEALLRRWRISPGVTVVIGEAPRAHKILAPGFKGMIAGIADKLSEIAGERIPVALLILTEPEPMYGSNIDRADAAREFEILLGLWREGMPDVPTHEVI